MANYAATSVELRAAKSIRRAPIWPVLIAPLTAIVYYAVLKSPFGLSFAGMLGDAATDVSEEGIWGSHWFYRLVAEISSVGFGTFVAAGLARHRELAAGIAGGITIAFGFVAFFLWFLIFPNEYEAFIHLSISEYLPEPNTITHLITIVPVAIAVPLIKFNPAAEPWYQDAIVILTVIVSPVMGIYVSNIARQMNAQHPTGFAGINQFHFTWLWLAAYWYALGLIEPVYRLMTREPSIDLLGILTGLPKEVIPAAMFFIPGFYGLALLSGHKGGSAHPVVRNLLGIIVIVLGILINMAIQLAFRLALRAED